MKPADRSPDEQQAPDAPDAPSRPWGPGSPAPGTAVADFDVSRDAAETLRASRATALYEAARFPELDDVAPSGAPGSETKSVGVGREDEGERGGLRILGVPAPKEIAGPVLAALALAAALYGWRRHRRRR
ncbi:MAG: hypothetical protein ABIS21_02760 [Acidimicrobiales bacterium]